MVNTERNANGAGSYAFILDENGVRIAYTSVDAAEVTDSPNLFKAIAPLPQKVQQRVTDEGLYGKMDGSPVSVLEDPALVNLQHDAHLPMTSQFVPAEQNETFQVSRQASSLLPWTYFVLSPLTTVTAVLNQQLLSTGLIMLAIIVLTVLIGLVAGQRITRPISRSVEYLRESSQSLKKQAIAQQNMVQEQTWIVESSHTRVTRGRVLH